MSATNRRETPLNPDLPRWQSWADQAISEAQERGDFDNLPGQGQPLQIEENREAGDWEMAFHLLKNAEMSPPWMELNREVQAEMAALTAIRERYCRLMTATEPGAAPMRPAARPWWAFWRAAPGAPPVASLAPEQVEEAQAASVRQLKRAYLTQAARLDEVIAAYNAWLPEDLRRLTRPRMTPVRAAREFEELRCPGA
ncbi:MAG: DUF1992 domain-containing protein [Thermomicrobiales bacterium]